jgi:hypothetical protein
VDFIHEVHRVSFLEKNMGDRCYLEITMRRIDLPKFAAFANARPDEKWWDNEDEADTPDLVLLKMYEVNYAWGEQREKAAAAGIPFFGMHDAGGDYGSYAFAACDGAMCETQLNHCGDLVVTVDENLEPTDDIENLRAYADKLKNLKTLFGIAGAQAA